MASITLNTAAAARRRRRRRVPDENRKRAARACDRCKARKSKCIETVSGVCQRCSRNSLSCRFQRELSVTKAPSEISHDDNEDTAQSIDSVIQTSPAGAYSIDSHPTERFMWPRFLTRLRETFSLDSDPTKESNLIASMQTQTLPTLPLQPAELQRLRKAVDAFPPRPVAEFLLSVCIDYGTDSFFYFNQAEFLIEINDFYTNPSSRLRSDCSFVCLAHAAFALGSQWTTLARPTGSQPSVAPDDNDPGRIFYNQARSLMPDVIEIPCLRAVQAPYVMGVYLLPASAIGASYMYLGIALRKALALDLHISSDDPNLSEEEKETRRRIWWSVYSLERASTVKLNRPRSISTSIISVDLPSSYDPLDRLQKFNNIEHQIADARLMMILDRIAEPSEWPATLEMLASFESELKGWKRSLPDTLRLQNIHPRSSYYRATFHLYTNYYFTWIAMGKVSVVTVVRAKLQYYLGQGSETPEANPYAESLAKHCVKAAKKMLRLFENIHSTGNLTRFSFTDFQACSIATIVVLLSGILERHAEYERQVSFGLECLTKMADGNSTAKMGVKFVEALQSITNEAFEKLLQTKARGASSSVEVPLGRSDYNSWATWLLLNKNGSGIEGSNVLDSVHLGTGNGPNLNVPAWPGAHIQSSSLGFATWDRATVPQQPSAPDMTSELTQSDQVSTAPQPIDNGYFSNMYNDDQAFLMGLTGFDVLGFSGLQDGI